MDETWIESYNFVKHFCLDIIICLFDAPEYLKYHKAQMVVQVWSVGNVVPSDLRQIWLWADSFFGEFWDLQGSQP